MHAAKTGLPIDSMQEAMAGRRQGGSPSTGRGFHSTAWGGAIGDVDPEEEVRML